MRKSLADGDAFHARNGEDIARHRERFIHSFQTFEGVELRDFCFLNRFVELADAHFVANVQSAVDDASNGEAAKILAVVEISDLQLQNAVSISSRAGNAGKNSFKQGP